MSDTLHRIGTRFIRQDDGGAKKEWYQSAGGDLLVWRDRKSKDEIVGFELTFGGEMQRALRHVIWEKGRSVRTGRIDTGERDGEMSPVVSASARPDPAVLQAAADFVSDRRRKLPDAVREFVIDRLAPPVNGTKRREE